MSFGYRIQISISDRYYSINLNQLEIIDYHWGTIFFFLHVNRMGLGVFERFFRAEHEFGLKSCLSCHVFE